MRYFFGFMLINMVITISPQDKIEGGLCIYP